MRAGSTTEQLTVVLLIPLPYPVRKRTEPRRFGVVLIRELEVSNVVAASAAFDVVADERSVGEPSVRIERNRLVNAERASRVVDTAHKARNRRHPDAVSTNELRISQERRNVAFVARSHAVILTRQLTQVGKKNPTTVLAGVGLDDTATVSSIRALRVPDVGTRSTGPISSKVVLQM